MTTSATKLAGGRQTRWTRDAVIDKIREWVSLYGEPPRAADWNPSSAKWSGQAWRISRYKEKGEGYWPSLNAAKKPFGGLNAAIKAAGFEPNRSGPLKRREAGPELERLDVSMHPAVRVALDDARRRAVEAEERMAVRERQLEAARSHVRSLEEALDASRRATRRATERASGVKVKTKTVTKTKTKVVDRGVPDAALMRERRKTERALVEAEKRRDETREARKTATRLAARLERAEATVNSLRAERKELKAELADATAAVAALEDKLTAANYLLAEAEARPVEVREVMSVEAQEVAEARRFRREAEERVAAAERKQLELAALVTGERRMLTAAETRALREGGPSGTAVLSAAMKELVKARAAGGRTAVKQALWEVASAAMRWRDSL